MTLVTVTRHDRPVVHVISAQRPGAILETMELLADPRFVSQLKRLHEDELKFHPASSHAGWNSRIRRHPGAGVPAPAGARAEASHQGRNTAPARWRRGHQGARGIVEAARG